MSAVPPAFRRAARLDGIEVSLIVQISEKAREARQRGEPVIGLGTGEPDFDTPQHIKDAAAAAMAAGDTRYPPTAGTAALRAAVAEKFRRENGLDYAADQIIVSTGAKQVLFNAFFATLEPGDEVIIPAPYWTSYLDIVRVCGGVPVIVDTRAEDGFRLDPEALRAAITPRTRWLLLNAPGNPSGATYTTAELRAALAPLADHPQVWVLSDDIYEHIRFTDGPFVTTAAAVPELRDRTLTLNGVSKAYAMTGWRIGYAAGPKPLIGAMIAAQGQSTSGACSIAQAASVAALTGPQDCVGEMVAVYRQRRDLVCAALNAVPGLSCPPPGGAFYVFPSCAGLFGRRTPAGATLTSAMDVATYLLESAHVAVVPGEAFGAPEHFRISTASATADLQEACRRIAAACAALS
ncbi:pyridoxal phosphate-dependent aminotransferase [Caenispirillum bisanense]|uniref:pyridoxal phosphate-dependent aminotransferase n=1 Tax=Caenispirillum bisanense TaxID=414052 RepID=UPI0031CF4FEF